MNINYKKLGLILIAVVTVIVIPAHFAHAQAGALVSLTVAAVYAIISNVLQLVFHLVGWLLAVAGGILNISINLTMNIKDFVTNVEGIYLVWQAIRDVSSLFIIFLLLYTSFRIILGLDEKISTLIKNIVIAGILINFSFFFTGLLIDASNVVSLAIYNAITPVAQECNVGKNLPSCSGVKFSDPKSYDGGLSAILMQSLRVTSIVSPKLANLDITSDDKSAVAQQLQIVFMQVAAILIMATTGLSFIVAAIAFIVRLVMLIFILAFSPIWFASWIFPQLKGLSDMFSKNLYKNLIFMPVYLFLLYAALRIVTSMNLLGNVGQISNISPLSGTITILVNYTIVALMLNLPLMAAVALGGISGKWMDRFGAQAVWGKVGGWTGSAAKWTGSQVGSRTVGRAAYSLGSSVMMKKLAAKSPLVGKLAYDGVDAVSNSGFGQKGGGYKDRLDAKKKSNESLHKRIGTVERGDYGSDAEFEVAKKEVETIQGQYRQKLPWKNRQGKPGGVIGFMVDNRSHRESQAKLEKEAKDKAKKEEEKTIRKNAKEKETTTRQEQQTLAKEKRDLQRDDEEINQEAKKQRSTLEAKKSTLETKRQALKGEIALTDTEKAELVTLENEQKSIEDELKRVEEVRGMTSDYKKKRLNEIEDREAELDGIIQEVKNAKAGELESLLKDDLEKIKESTKKES